MVTFGTLGVVSGLALLGIGLLNAFSGIFAKVFIVSGLVVLGIAWAAQGVIIPPIPPVPTPIPPTPTPTPPNPNPIPPTPNPGPAPNPVPPTPPTPNPIPPTPVTPFQQSIIQAFQLDRGQPADAAILAALWIEVAEQIIYDGTKSQPAMKMVSDIVRAMNKVQEHYYGMTPTPIATRFPNVQNALFAELQRLQLIDPGKSVPLDAARRMQASQMFRDAGNALAQIAGEKSMGANLRSDVQ
jgi:hypothetical protein